MSTEKIKRIRLTTPTNKDSKETAKQQNRTACQNGALVNDTRTETENENNTTQAQTTTADQVFKKYDTGTIFKPSRNKTNNNNKNEATNGQLLTTAHKQITPQEQLVNKKRVTRTVDSEQFITITRKKSKNIKETTQEPIVNTEEEKSTNDTETDTNIPNTMLEDTEYNIPTRNKFQPLEEDNESMETESEIEEEEIEPKNKTNPKKTNENSKNYAKRNKPPPIVVKGKFSDHEKIIETLKKEAINGFSFKFGPQNTSIYINDNQEYITIKQIFDENNTEYYTYTPKNEKTHAFVLKGLEIPVTTEDIMSEIKDKHNLKIINVYKMKNTKRPLYLVVTDSKVTLKHMEATVKVIYYTKIKWERHINNKIIIQCHRCQDWGHATTNCRANPVCLKCAKGHWTRECPKQTNEPPKCSNCEGEHTANNIKCQVYINKITTLEKTREKNRKNNPRYNRTYEERIYSKTEPAQPPKTNAWEERNKLKTNEQQQQYRFNQQDFPHLPTEDERQHKETTHQQQRPHNQDKYYNSNTQQNTFEELTSEFSKLNNLINMKTMLSAVKDLNMRLAQCTNQMEKFKVFYDFTNELEQYGP